MSLGFSVDMLHYKTTAKYEELIQSLKDVGTAGDCGDIAQAKPIQSCFRSDDLGNEHFECTLHLRKWRWKGVSGKERINILVHAHETIRRSDLLLLSSNVCVNYFHATEGGLLQAFHFDYDPTQKDHPLFHMQVTNRCLTLSQEDIAELEIQLPAEIPAGLLRCARVPTCDMTLASVLLCLAADHVGGAIFAEFLDRICNIQEGMPHPDITKLKASFSDTEDVRSSHWFRHLLPKN